MKKLFLFLAATAITITSCSKDDNGGGSSMSLKIGSVTKKFKTFATTFDGETYVYGYIGSESDPTETLSFDVTNGTGTDNIINFFYTNETDSFTPETTLTSNVTTNTTTSVKGAFSGTLEPFDGGENIVITDGTFSSKVVPETEF